MAIRLPSSPTTENGGNRFMNTPTLNEKKIENKILKTFFLGKCFGKKLRFFFFEQSDGMQSYPSGGRSKKKRIPLDS